ncbi:energy transducer TonB family protein [Pseudomonas huanghezhanensis]|uniref:energy transducer TonB family protein n=1 Tax=Pseudomonas huanghezhanensis TaxID=3002903 RepID=UPI0022853F24|nr:energy transducer TonB [Pseudomonas sp. BSw22131]
MVRLGRKLCAFALCVLCTFDGLADEIFDEPELEYLRFEPPVFPASFRKPVYGSVRITYWVTRDGKLIDLDVEHSSHPEFERSVRQAVALWRFKPWTSNQSTAPALRQELNIFFGDTLGDKNTAARTRLRFMGLRCAAFNSEHRGRNRSRSRTAGQILASQALDITRSLIVEGVVAERISYHDSVVLFENFDASLQGLVKACREAPESRYVDNLPQDLRFAIGAPGA